MTRNILTAPPKGGKQISFIVGEVLTDYISPKNCPKITGSKDAEVILRASWDGVEYIESFRCLYLNRANKCIGNTLISTGGVSGTVADPKVIFQKALACNASGIILAHNHPSGNLTPSQADIDLTKKLREAGKFLEIQVLDHVILTDEKYFSFADEGLI